MRMELLAADGLLLLLLTMMNHKYCLVYGKQ